MSSDVKSRRITQGEHAAEADDAEEEPEDSGNEIKHSAQRPHNQEEGKEDDETDQQN